MPGSDCLQKEAVYHINHGNYAYPVAKDTLRVTVRAARADLQKATVLYGDRYEAPPTKAVQMELVAKDELFDYFQADLKLATKRFAYVFLLDDGVRSLFYTEKGFFPDLEAHTHFQYPYIAKEPWAPPAWAQGAVIYQIFPDRFAKGDPNLDPPVVEPWDALPTRNSYKGGDLQGIMARFQHLLDLGVDALYLTPIFQAPSNHKYDTANYYRLDPYFGHEETFHRLLALCRRHKIKVILDGVFNHCGQDFFAFQDVLAQGENSAYAHWFKISAFPLKTNPTNYETFGNQIAALPKLNTNEGDVQRFFYEVGVYWLREFAIDGWRLDAANEVAPQFWRGFRTAVKKENPEALLAGEIWHPANPWLEGDQLDTVTNYPWRDACLDFFAKGTIGAQSFGERLAKMQIAYPGPVKLALWNLLGSHDTERFLTACAGHLGKFRLAVAFQMTYEGAPLIYYGDEVGMGGGADPLCRGGMIWDFQQQNRGLLAWYRSLIKLRKAHPVFQKGRYRLLVADNVTNMFGFIRYDEKGEVRVLFNNCGQKCNLSWRELGHTKNLRDLLSGEEIKKGRRIPFKPYQVRVLA